MGHTYTYVSLTCSNYHALIATLLQRHIPFEFHVKARGCGKDYLDFTLDNERDPGFGELMETTEHNLACRSKKFEVRVLSKYTY